MTNPANKTALITGGASGIGRLMAEQLAALGARVVLWDINASGLDEVAAGIRARGGTADTFACDLADANAIHATAARVLAEVGGVDILVNNAGIVIGKSFLETTDAQTEKIFAINSLALIRITREFLPGMIARGQGHIVNIASAAGIVGVPRLADYCASKWAAIGFDEALRLELRHAGHSKMITTVVCPYYIATGMFAGVRTRFPLLLPIMKPKVVAARIVRAIRKNHRRVVMPRFAVFAGRTRA